MHHHRNLLTAIGLLIAITIFSACTTTENTSSQLTVPQATSVSSTSGPIQTSSDQTLSKTISYSTPEGTESIKVQLTIDNGVVTQVKDIHTGNDRHSVRYQQAFEQSISSQVVGKKISEINVIRVGGASLTSVAFMKAINSMK